MDSLTIKRFYRNHLDSYRKIVITELVLSDSKYHALVDTIAPVTCFTTLYICKWSSSLNETDNKKVQCLDLNRRSNYPEKVIKKLAALGMRKRFNLGTRTLLLYEGRHLRNVF